MYLHYLATFSLPKYFQSTSTFCEVLTSKYFNLIMHTRNNLQPQRRSTISSTPIKPLRTRPPTPRSDTRHLPPDNYQHHHGCCRRPLPRRRQGATSSIIDHYCRRSTVPPRPQQPFHHLVTGHRHRARNMPPPSRYRGCRRRFLPLSVVVGHRSLM